MHGSRVGHRHDVAIGAGKNQVKLGCAGVEPGATRKIEALDGVRVHAVQHGPGQTRLGRQVDEYPPVAAQVAPVAGHRPYGRFDTRVAPDLGHAHAHRLAIPRALQRHRPAHGGNHQIVAEQVGVRAVAAECGHAHPDQIGIDVVSVVRGQPPGGQWPIRPRLEQEPGPRQQRLQGTAVGRRGRVEDDGAFVAVERLERQAGVVSRRVTGERRLAARGHAARRLDADDIRTQIAQHHGAEFAAYIGAIQNTV